MKKTMVVDLISCLYICLFLYTGLFKLVNNLDFKNTLNHQPLFRHYEQLVAIVIPILELLIALALLMPFFKQADALQKWGLRIGTSLMALFSIYVAYMLISTPHALPCSCGGIIRQLNWHHHLYFNATVTILGILAIILHNNELRSENRNLAFS
ncbi:MAG TPA: MauE/DoxX family redox-associated membrane protein [Puia sp.]|nr:MauE/DoxX family redox-associated membrane protein [Puia sp.]